MSAPDLRRLVEYHYWARDRILDAAALLSADDYTRDLGSSFPSVRDTLVHIFGAEVVWYSRWQGHSPSSLPAATEFPDVAALRTAWTAQETLLRAYVGGLTDDALLGEIEYRTTGGKLHRERLADLLAHVVNHSSYHRGQVATMLRQLKAAPPLSTDLIAFLRERAR